MCTDRQMGQAYLRWVLGAGGIGGVGLVPLPTELRSFGNGIHNVVCQEISFTFLNQILGT